MFPIDPRVYPLPTKIWVPRVVTPLYMEMYHGTIGPDLPYELHTWFTTPGDAFRYSLRVAKRFNRIFLKKEA